MLLLLAVERPCSSNGHPKQLQGEQLVLWLHALPVTCLRCEPPTVYHHDLRLRGKVRVAFAVIEDLLNRFEQHYPDPNHWRKCVKDMSCPCGKFANDVFARAQTPSQYDKLSLAQERFDSVKVQVGEQRIFGLDTFSNALNRLSLCL